MNLRWRGPSLIALIACASACGGPTDPSKLRRGEYGPVKTVRANLLRGLPDVRTGKLQDSKVESVAVDPELAHLLGVKAGFLTASDLGPTYFVDVEARTTMHPPLVLVHGLGSAGVRDFYPILDALSRERRVIAVELPGLGRSRLGGDKPEPNVFASRINSVIAALLGEEAFDLLGHSLGGAVSLIVASSQQERMRRLVLVDVAGILTQDAFAGSQIQYLTGAVSRGSSLGGHALVHVGDRLIDAGQALRPGDEFLLWGSEKLAGVQLQAALHLVQYNMGEVLNANRHPTSIIWGLKDRIAPLRSAELLSSRMKSSRLTFLADAGHTPMLEQPRKLAGHILQFLDAEAPPAPTKNAPWSSQRFGRCEHHDGVIFEGDFAELWIEECSGVVLDRVRVERLWLVESEAAMSRSEVFEGIVARESQIRITGGSVAGDVGLLLQESEADVAGTQILGRHASVQSEGESDLVLSSCSVKSSRGEGAAHGHWVLEDRQGF